MNIFFSVCHKICRTDTDAPWFPTPSVHFTIILCLIALGDKHLNNCILRMCEDEFTEADNLMFPSCLFYFAV